MSLSPFRHVPAWQRALRSSAAAISVGVHVALALYMLATPAAAKKAAQWVDMAINEPKPPPPGEPEPPKPAPEPPKPKPIPKVVKFQDIPPTPPPEAAPPLPDPTPRRVVRPIQGLTANSFAPGTSTGLSVRAGNTTAVAAGKETMGLADAGGPFDARPYTAVTTAPRRRWAPTMEVPDDARKAGIEGRIEVLLDIDAAGKVMRVRIVKGLGFGADEACADTWKKSMWQPAKQDGAAVAVTGLPEACRVDRLE